MNEHNQNSQPIRRYRRRRSYNSSRTILVLAMTVILLVGVVVFIMSLTGTGLFADRQSPKVPLGGDTTTAETEEPPAVTDDGTEESTKGTEDPDVTLPDGEVSYKFIALTPEDIGAGDLVLIDAQNIYKFPTVSLDNIYANKTSSYWLSGSSLMLKTSVINELNKMMDAFYAATGFAEASVNDAYRSFDVQNGLYERNPNTAARPGCSDYHTGATIYLVRYDSAGDKVYDLSGSSEAAWLKENAHKYGFTFRYPTGKKDVTGYEIPWQMRYVGIPHATYMYEKFLCLEEYLIYLADNHRYGQEPLTVECADGIVYEIFYVQGAAEGVIQVPVPENRDYTVSGDNKNGFIVTVAARSVGETE